MFISDKLIYIQMQKTGCTHISLLLSRILEGKQVGKHNPASAKQINSDDYFFISSIRNPWDWYLSLWTYGVQGKGGLYSRLTNSRKTKNTSLYNNLYNDGGNINLFRKWLKFIHNPDNANLLGEGYGKSAITELCGFMTYRYLYLCCSNHLKLNNPKLISNYIELDLFEKKSCYIDFFIHNESLENDLSHVIEKIRPLSGNEKNIIMGAKKTNTSKRLLTISDYYDEESIELIRHRDRLLIDKFNYEPPQLTL